MKIKLLTLLLTFFLNIDMLEGKEIKIVKTNIKGAEILNKAVDTDAWLHDQLNYLLSYCDKEKIDNENWLTGTFSVPSDKYKELICNSLENEGVNLECNAPNFFINKDEIIPRNGLPMHYIFATKKQAKNGAIFNGISDCTLNDAVKKETRYKLRKYVEYELQPVKYLRNQNINISMKKSIKVLSGSGILIPQDSLLKEEIRLLIIK
jgi:hypothetical protein